MTAKLIPVGEPAHDAERQALRHLVEGLPDAYTIYSNPWLSQRDGAIYEIDAVVAAPHAIFVVELKAYRGDVRGTDYDWYTPEPIRSPLGLNRKTAQVLKSELRRASYEAGRVWVEGLVFLSHAASVSLTGEASRHRVHDRATIVRALTDASYFHAHLGGHVAAPVDPHTADVLHRVLTGGDPRHKPVHQIGQYQLLGEIDRADAYTEYLAQHTMMDERRVLRVYTVPWSAGDAAGHCHGARPGTCPGAAGPPPRPEVDPLRLVRQPRIEDVDRPDRAIRRGKEPTGLRRKHTWVVCACPRGVGQRDRACRCDRDIGVDPGQCRKLGITPRRPHGRREEQPLTGPDPAPSELIGGGNNTGASLWQAQGTRVPRVQDVD